MARFTILAALASAPSAAQAASGSGHVNDPEYIQRLNAVPGATWRAASHKFFEGMSVGDARVLLGAELSPISEHLNQTRPQSIYDAIPNDDVPSDFDSRTQWPDLIHPIRDQQACGSCWAFSASEVLSDRVAIATGKASPVLSPEDLVSCDRVDQGCSGGNLPSAWKYLTEKGVVTDACMPYTAGDGIAPRCRRKCADSETFVRTKAQSAYAINGVANMQKDIMTNGPIQVGFRVFRSFMNYKSGIYHKHIWELLPEGGHAVKIIGWGVEDRVNYWTVANSWNTDWGEEGFFRIVRGKNACDIERMGPPYAGLAATGEGDLIVV